MRRQRLRHLAKWAVKLAAVGILGVIYVLLDDHGFFTILGFFFIAGLIVGWRIAPVLPLLIYTPVFIWWFVFERQGSPRGELSTEAQLILTLVFFTWCAVIASLGAFTGLAAVKALNAVFKDRTAVS